MSFMWVRLKSHWWLHPHLQLQTLTKLMKFDHSS